MMQAQWWLTTAMVIVLSGAQHGLGSQDDGFPDHERNRGQSFDAYSRNNAQAFRDFALADSVAYSAFRREVEERWDSFRVSTRREWVQYSQDLDSRWAVDFERGKLEIEVSARAGEDALAQRQRLIESLSSAITSTGTTDDFAGRGRDPRLGPASPISEQPLLEGQVADGSGGSVTPGQARAFARQTLDSTPLHRIPYVDGQGVARVRLRLTMPLVPNHLRRRAERYLQLVRDKIHEIARIKEDAPMTVELVMAIMHTESYFNPKARSSAPAYGLMQLVPSSGAADAMSYLEGGQAPRPSGRQLYRPELNVRLGVAYLSRLWNEYYGDVEDPECRLYCVIAAYNTGPGNVNRAINKGNPQPRGPGKSRFGPAIARVNREFAGRGGDFKALLMSALPFTETRDYLRMVSTRMGTYAEWGSAGRTN